MFEFIGLLGFDCWVLLGLVVVIGLTIKLHQTIMELHKIVFSVEMHYLLKLRCGGCDLTESCV